MFLGFVCGRRRGLRVGNYLWKVQELKSKIAEIWAIFRPDFMRGDSRLVAIFEYKIHT